jgi:hypothetical protein
MKILFKVLLPLVLLLAKPAVAQAQFTFTTNNGTITITDYTGPGGDVVIPSSTSGLPVTTIGAYVFVNSGLTNVTIPGTITSIGEGAFEECGLTEVTLPDNVTNIGPYVFMWCLKLNHATLGTGVTTIGKSAFEYCWSLTNVSIPRSLNNIGDFAFADCSSLTAIPVDALNPVYSSFDGVLFNKEMTMLVEYPYCKGSNYIVPDGVTSIRDDGFFYCRGLVTVTIPASVTNIGVWTFSQCTSLTGVYFKGNAPSLASASAFTGAAQATVYFLPGTLGWGSTFGQRPTALWTLPYPVILNNSLAFDLQTGTFGFTISWATNIPVVVEACTSLPNHSWTTICTNTLNSGTNYFSDPNWTSYPARFYRVRSP